MASSPRRSASAEASATAQAGMPGFPQKQGMYNPAFEKDACGLAMVATLRGEAGHDIIDLALTALRNLEHRGAIGSDAGTGDGGGGNDFLAGGANADTFVYRSGDDAVLDFNPEVDILDLTFVLGLDDFDDAFNLASEDGDDLVFDLDRGDVTLYGIGLDDINASNVLTNVLV